MGPVGATTPLSAGKNTVFTSLRVRIPRHAPTATQADPKAPPAKPTKHKFAKVDIYDALHQFSEALTIVEPVSSALQAAQSAQECSTIGAEIATLQQGVRAIAATLKAVHIEAGISQEFLVECADCHRAQCTSASHEFQRSSDSNHVAKHDDPSNRSGDSQQDASALSRRPNVYSSLTCRPHFKHRSNPTGVGHRESLLLYCAGSSSRGVSWASSYRRRFRQATQSDSFNSQARN